MRKALLASVAIVCFMNSANADELIYFDTPKGTALLSEAHGTAGFGSLVRFREPQRLQTYCSVSSSIAVLNSLDIKSEIPTPDIYPYNSFNQYSFFTNKVMDIKKPIEVQSGNKEGVGVPLDQLVQMLNTFENVVATAYHGDKVDLNETRRLIAEAESNPNKRVIINYHRKSIGQSGGGHFSPISAYSEATDRVLILDTAAYKYPPVWVTMADLHAAMNTTDEDAKSTRGFIIIEKVVPKPSPKPVAFSWFNLSTWQLKFPTITMQW